jgi:hypothetical protein
MRLLKGQRWTCQYRYCGSEIEVVSASHVDDGMNPRCSCGGMMKKKAYSKPAPKVSDTNGADIALRRKAASDAT